MRIVRDTNVFIAPLITKDRPSEKLYRVWRADKYNLLTSKSQLDDLKRVVHRCRLQRFLSLQEALVLIETVGRFGTIVDPLPTVGLSSDPDDNLILAAAIGGDADLLVSSDKKHMLSLGHASGIPIVSPEVAMKQLGID